MITIDGALCEIDHELEEILGKEVWINVQSAIIEGARTQIVLVCNTVK